MASSSPSGFHCELIIWSLLIVLLSASIGKGKPATGQVIIGGKQNAKIAQHPYLVSIHYGRQAMPFCGGAILDSRTILTAASCFDQDPPHCSQPGVEPTNCYQLVAGEHDLFVDEGHEQVLEFNSSPSTLVRHEDYDSFHYDNDIALIRLEEPLLFNEYVQPIALVDPELPYKSHGAKIAGWGKLSTESEMSVNVLQSATVDIFSPEKCYESWGDDYNPESMLCACGRSNGGSELVADACHGDTGGPLVAKGVFHPHQNYLVGIISFGFECGYPEYPGVYTRVENYLSWIKENRGPSST